MFNKEVEVGKINIYLEVAKEVEYLMLRESLEFKAALRQAKEKYKKELEGSYEEKK